MELTISIKEQKNIAVFLNLLKKYDFVEIVDVKEVEVALQSEHKAFLEERLEKIKAGNTTFKSWNEIKAKYEK